VAAPYDITTFDDGYTGLQITIVGRNADCTVKQGSNLKLSADWPATLYHTLTLEYGSVNWFERGRSANA
jgi:hypothetical protein